MPPLGSGDKKSKIERYKCEFCPETFQKQLHLDLHEFTHTKKKKYICEHEDCNKEYKILQHLKRHEQITHEKQQSTKIYMCELECGKEFSNIYNMERHVEQIHADILRYGCHICPKRFRRKLQLRKHTIEHTGEFPFKCNKCGKGFLLEALFNRHCNSSKSYCKLYKCETCSEEFQKWSVLVAHRKAQHTTFSFKCETCGRVFKRRDCLRKHEEIHKDDNEKMVYTCPEENCNRFYFQSQNLSMHIRLKHRGLTFQCTVEGCGRSLASKKKLELHQAWHKKPKPTRKRKPAAKRKDFGTKKVPTASVLSGIKVDATVAKMVLAGEGDKLDIEIEDLGRTDSEMEDGAAPAEPIRICASNE